MEVRAESGKSVELIRPESGIFSQRSELSLEYFPEVRPESRISSHRSAQSLEFLPEVRTESEISSHRSAQSLEFLPEVRTESGMSTVWNIQPKVKSDSGIYLPRSQSRVWNFPPLVRAESGISTKRQSRVWNIYQKLEPFLASTVYLRFSSPSAANRGFLLTN